MEKDKDSELAHKICELMRVQGLNPAEAAAMMITIAVTVIKSCGVSMAHIQRGYGLLRSTLELSIEAAESINYPEEPLT